MSNIVCGRVNTIIKQKQDNIKYLVKINKNKDISIKSISSRD